MRLWRYGFLMVGLFWFGLGLSPTHAQTHSLEWWTIDNGGSFQVGATLKLGATAAQPDACEEIVGPTYSLTGGVWFPAPPAPPACEGDVNGDRVVDDGDLLQVLFAFGTSGEDLPEDQNGDGTVDDADLLIVLFNFGNSCQ